MEPMNVLDARNNLSRLVTAASNGEDVVISKRGHPLVRLVAVERTQPQHTAAQAAHWLTTNLAPRYSSRTPAELDQQIILEREGWE